ncbi:MAG: universal stress protein [Betaproteobacteria bacterium]|nr:universal stress protein [Betaproteobacteria bacterium]
MAYKTILVHVDNSPQWPGRFEVAARLAAEFEAHLVGICLLRRPELPGYIRSAEIAEMLAQRARDAEDKVKASRQMLLDRLSQEGLSGECRVVEGEVEELASVHGRYADLLIVSQADVNAPNSSAAMDEIQSVIFAAGRPLLLVPYAGKVKTLGKNIFVAWNASREATRAVTDALPLLQRAGKVTVMVVRPRADSRAHGDVPGADIAAYLARHGVKVDVMAEEGEGIDVGELMLSRVADLGSDLIVMGAYSHSRLRQWILGGATRTMLESMTVPVLMSH